MSKNSIYQSPDGAAQAPAHITPTIIVSAEKWADAWIAFYEALGVDGLTAFDAFADGVTCDSEGINVVIGSRVTGVDPVVVGDGPDEPFGVWGWPIRIEREAID